MAAREVADAIARAAQDMTRAAAVVRAYHALVERRIHDTYRTESQYAAAEDALETAAVSLAAALVVHAMLARRDQRFDFPVIRQQLLEYLPTLVVADPGVVGAEHLGMVSDQLDAIAGEIAMRTRPVPKDMPLPPKEE